MALVPAERVVTCPHCGENRSTRADRNVRVKCSFCKASFRVPGEDARGDAHVAGAANPPIDLARLDPANRGPVVVEAAVARIKPARATKAAGATKAAAKGPASRTDAGTPAPLIDVEKLDELASTPAPATQADFQKWGRRGGLARYEKTRGARGSR